ncbi:MAG: hypothetical protein K6G22_09905 [Lachnospiraceae bacterium]|nr:hypothetical protein [Lachnospiraceae bacterium]
MSKNLLKSSSIIVKGDGKRMINSNDLIAEKIQKLTEILEMEKEEDFADGFSEGLEAEQVEALLNDPDADPEAVAQAKESASEIIARANEDAESILGAAGEERERILSAAEREAQDLKNESITAGHDEGYRAGYDAGMADIDAMKAELLQEKEELERQYEKKYEELEPVLVETLTGIYSHVLGISLENETGVIMNLLKDTIRSVEGGKNFMVHVSSSDFAYVSAYRDDLLNCVGGIDSLEVIEDVTLGSSDCFVECESGIYDCGLGTELSLLKKELRLLSYHDE